MKEVPFCIVDQMAKAFGTDSESLSYLGGGKEFSDGIVYSFSKDQKPYALKILYLDGGNLETRLKEMAERLDFVHFSGELGVRIVHPLKSPSGRIYEQVDANDGLYLGYVMDKIQGQPILQTSYDDSFIRAIGKTTGQMHRSAKNYPKWKGNGPDGDCEVLGWRQEVEFFTGWCADEEIKARWNEMRHVLETIPYDRDCFGFIHNDLHIGNMIHKEDGIYLLDFDVANFHWFVYDIMTASQHFMYSVSGGFDRPVKDADQLKAFFHHFMEGYESENHLSNQALKQIDLFLNYRRMILFTAMQEMMNQKPELKTAYKGMIESNPSITSILGI